MGHRSRGSPQVAQRTDLSPDGRIAVDYAESGGARTPRIAEPRARLAATNEVLVDLWGSGLDGRVDAFAEDRFRITVRDSRGMTEVVARVNVRDRTFALTREPDLWRSLIELRASLRRRIEDDQALRRRAAANLERQPPARWWTRLLAGLRIKV